MKMFWKRTIAQFVTALLGGVFLWAAYLQLNDADGWIWVLVYLSAAVLAFLASAGRPMPQVAGRLIFFTFAFSCYLGIQAISPRATDMFEYGEKTGWTIVDTEEGREAGGLALISVMLFGIIRKWPLLQKPKNAADDDGGEGDE